MRAARGGYAHGSAFNLLFLKSDELGVKPRAVELGYVPLITEYLAGGFVQPLALAHMEVCCTSTYRIILYGVVISKTVGDDVFIVLVFAKLLLLLVKPYIEACVAFSNRSMSKLSINTSGRMALSSLSGFIAQKIRHTLEISSTAHRKNPLTEKIAISDQLQVNTRKYSTDKARIGNSF